MREKLSPHPLNPQADSRTQKIQLAPAPYPATFLQVIDVH